MREDADDAYRRQLDAHMQRMQQRMDHERVRKAARVRTMISHGLEDAWFLEECVMDAVAAALGEETEVVQRMRYEFQGDMGDVAGLVVGAWDGHEVAVLVEATHDVDRDWRKAAK